MKLYFGRKRAVLASMGNSLPLGAISYTALKAVGKPERLVGRRLPDMRAWRGLRATTRVAAPPLKDPREKKIEKEMYREADPQSKS